ncbi:hypothetical protein BLM37_04645 [Candidatus Gracilibacteria bacterium GN02-873]|nr:hypothetical protein BLM37_04645 [Candidatus Gracilibacteria bacterium GN02-873]
MTKIHTFPDEEKIIKQIQEEYKEGLDHVRQKRAIKQEEIKDYVESSKDKVRKHIIYTFMQAYMSVLYTGTHTVRWSGEGGRIQEKAENLNQVAEFDYKEMGLAEKDYNWIWSAAFYGVSVQLQDGFDTTTKTPIFKNVHSLSFIPDPYFTSFDISGHRYFGLEMEATLSEMKRKGWKNIDIVSSQKFTRDSYRDYVANYRSLGRTEKTDGVFPVYYHFTEYNNKKYFCVLANECNTLLHMEEIQPVYDEEKDVTHLNYPIVLRYFSPLEGDAYGVSLVDLVKGDQRNASELLNLVLIKARKQAYGNDVYYDQNSLPEEISIEDLNKPSVNGRKIPLDIQPGSSIRDVLYEAQQQGQESGVYDAIDRLNYNAKESTGMDYTTIGLANPNENTLGEQKIAQKNAGNRFMLMVKYAKWAEKARWNMWRRCYLANKKSVKEKIVQLVEPTNRVFNHILQADDFITSEILHINVEFKIEAEERNRKQVQFISLAPTLLSIAKSETQKAIIQRKQLELMGMEQAEILRMIPYTLDELKARTLLELLSNDDEQGLIIEDIMQEDHQVYIDIFRQGTPTEMLNKGINNRLMALEYRERRMAEQNAMANMEDQGQLNSMANIGTAQLANNAIAQKNSEAGNPVIG